MAQPQANNQVNLGELSSTISGVGKAFIASKVWKIVAFVVIALGVGIYFIVKAIKKSALNDIPLPNLPTGDVVDVNKGISTTAEFEQYAKELAAELLSVTKGVLTLAATKEKTFKKLWQLNDTQLVYVYRVFSKEYYKELQKTMTQMIDEELNYVLEYNGGVKDRLVTRLRSLGAK